ncbi:MAG TPA: hypothetical protein VF273_01055 [Pelobium sp.]
MNLKGYLGVTRKKSGSGFTLIQREGIIHRPVSAAIPYANID